MNGKKGLTLGLGILMGAGLVCGVAAANAPVDLPACPTEDSDNCYWDAALMGDGNGRSFDAIDGQVYYWDEREPSVPPVVIEEPVATDIPAPVEPTQAPVEPAPAEPTPEPAPAEPAPEPVTETPSQQKLDWDTGTLECGVNAKPAIDQDQYGNWWAYCEPALVGG